MGIDYEAFSEWLYLIGANKAALIDYIYRTQGGASCRIDYAEAAKEVGVSERTIGRYIAELADKKLLVLSGERGAGEVRLSEKILK